MANALAVGPRPDLSWGSSSTCRCLSGWWFGNVWNMFYDFPLSWEFHHPNWRTPSFSRWVGIPPTGYLFGLSSRVSIFRGAPDGPSCNPRQSENQGPIHGFTLKLITGWWFGTCFTFPYVGKKNPKKPPTIIYIYIHMCYVCDFPMCNASNPTCLHQTQHDLRICPYWKVVEFQPDELGDSTGATSAWLKETADALGGGSGCVR